MRPRFVKQDQVVIMRLECSGVVCLEEFKLFPQMGRFTLRDEGLYLIFRLTIHHWFTFFTKDLYLNMFYNCYSQK